MLASASDRVWIIPAYAGSTGGTAAQAAGPTDHPRIRGEHSPRNVSHITLSGIIPAYAGSTVSATSTAPTPPDHPRIRGEHLTPHRRHF